MAAVLGASSGCKSTDRSTPDVSATSDIASGNVLFWVEGGTLNRGECKNGLPALRINCTLNVMSHPMNARFNNKWAALSGQKSPTPTKDQHDRFEADRNAKLKGYDEQLAKIDKMISESGSNPVLEGQKTATKNEKDQFASATLSQLEALKTAKSYGEFVTMALATDIVFNANTNQEMAPYKSLIDSMNKTLTALERGFLCQANLDRTIGGEGYIPHYVSGFSRDRGAAASKCQASYDENYYHKKSRNHNESCSTNCKEVYKEDIPGLMNDYIRVQNQNRAMKGVLVPTRY